MSVRRLALPLFLLASACSGPPRFAPTPGAARIVTDDLARFYAVFDALADSVSVDQAGRQFEAGYFRPGSDGLRAFRDRTGDTETFTTSVLERRRFYTAIRDRVLDTRAYSALADSARDAYRALERIYPDARFPDVYVVVGKLSTGGTPKRAGLVLGAEHYADGPGVPRDELSAWQRQAVSSQDELLAIVVHELMHAQQKGVTQRTVAGRAMSEGCADYVTERLVGRHPYAAAEAWARPRAAELWAEFEPALDDSDLGDWFFAVPERDGQPDRPVDLGYVLGAWICQAYVDNAADPAAALREVIRLEDPDRIVRESGFDGRPGPDAAP